MSAQYSIAQQSNDGDACLIAWLALLGWRLNAVVNAPLPYNALYRFIDFLSTVADRYN